jgi:hypothetical protein
MTVYDVILWSVRLIAVVYIRNDLDGVRSSRIEHVHKVVMTQD